MNMKYSFAKVIGHQRSGSHFFAKTLNDNFFHKENYLDLYTGHSRQHLQWIKHPNMCVFYTYRNTEDSVESMYRMRDRFGLVANSLEEFKTKKIKDMYSRKINANTIFYNGVSEKLITEVDGFLSGINKTVENYLDSEKKFWLYYSCPNYMPVSYDDLMEDYDSTMIRVAQFLGSDKREFTKEKSRIGWYDKSDIKQISS